MLPCRAETRLSTEPAQPGCYVFTKTNSRAESAESAVIPSLIVLRCPAAHSVPRHRTETGSLSEYVQVLNARVHNS